MTVVGKTRSGPRRSVWLLAAVAVGGGAAAAAGAGPLGPSDDSPPLTVAVHAAQPARPLGPVQRGTAHTGPRTSAAAGRFSPTAPATYPDGLTVTVARVSRAAEKGRGPGVFPGRPLMVLHLVATNRGAAPVDLDQVVVTTTYGARPSVAPAVYDDSDVADFSGVVRPGASASATYAFSIPPGQGGRVTTTVDLDGRHAPATFTGAVTS